MSIIDLRRIAAVKELEKLGYSFTLDASWTPSTGSARTQARQLSAEAMPCTRSSSYERIY
jgi:hypothetical protein